MFAQLLMGLVQTVGGPVVTGGIKKLTKAIGGSGMPDSIKPIVYQGIGTAVQFGGQFLATAIGVNPFAGSEIEAATSFQIISSAAWHTIDRRRRPRRRL